jgi:hypothetical protein
MLLSVKEMSLQNIGSRSAQLGNVVDMTNFRCYSFLQSDGIMCFPTDKFSDRMWFVIARRSDERRRPDERLRLGVIQSR